MKTRLTPFSKLLIVAGIIAAGVFAANKFNLINFEKTSSEFIETDDPKNETPDYDDEKVIKIGVVTWGGYAGGQYFNEGFKANKNSRFYKEYGFMVEFKVLDDFVASRDAWKADEVNLLWATIDAFTTEVNGLKDYKPKAIFQADWSRGGDAVVVRRGISKMSDLKGKTVAFAEMTPSHTFLLWMLEAANLKYSDIKPKIVASAIDAADLFKKGQVDAAVVWSPDDTDCVAKVKGSKILQSTREASNIIADVFVVKDKYLNENREMLKNLLKGWFIGASEINTSESAKKKASRILSEGLAMPEDFCYQAINNVRLCTYGDNVNFYGLNPKFKGVTGEEIYNKMEMKYKETGYIKSRLPAWSLVGDHSLLDNLPLKTKEQEAEKSTTFTEATDEVRQSEAISTKEVSITFASGSYQLDENMKYIIDMQFLDIAKSFANARIRIEGNTDSMGGAEANRVLSRQRAQAVANYLISEQGFDKNRFIIVGNGPDKPVASNATAEGRSKNRRTDFQLLSD